MCNFNIKRQINKLYTLTTVSYFRIAGASWVALLALRGFSLLQIGILESIFHIASSCFEILWKEKDAGSFEAGQCAVLSGYDFI